MPASTPALFKIRRLVGAETKRGDRCEVSVPYEVAVKAVAVGSGEEEAVRPLGCWKLHCCLLAGRAAGAGDAAGGACIRQQRQPG